MGRIFERDCELSRALEGEKGKLYPLKADVSKEEDILSTFVWIKKNLGGVDILINNAAVADATFLSDVSTDILHKTFNLDVIGLSICTREAIKSMKERGVNDGHIIHINSVLGHKIANIPGLNAYTAAKHAVTVLTEGLRRELVQQKSKIKVTSLSPGAVETDMLRRAKENMPAGIQIPAIQAEDIANAAIYILGTPPHVQIHELTISHVDEGV